MVNTKTATTGLVLEKTWGFLVSCDALLDKGLVGSLWTDSAKCHCQAPEHYTCYCRMLQTPLSTLSLVDSPNPRYEVVDAVSPDVVAVCPDALAVVAGSSLDDVALDVAAASPDGFAVAAAAVSPDVVVAVYPDVLVVVAGSFLDEVALDVAAASPDELAVDVVDASPGEPAVIAFHFEGLLHVGVRHHVGKEDVLFQAPLPVPRAPSRRVRALALAAFDESSLPF